MRQLRFYIPLSLEINKEYEIPETSARHMVRVLRLGEDDEVTLFNGDNNEYLVRIIAATKKNVSVLVLKKTEANRESPLHTHLIQSLSKGDKMESTIQKAVELGVSAITPVSSERSNVSLAGPRLEKKMLHWQGVIQSASEQTGRNKLADLNQLCSLKATLDFCRDSNALKLILNPHADVGLAEMKDRPESVVILIGPEGGLSDAEIAYAQDCGFVATKTGPRVLRTETAGPAVLAISQMLWGDYS